MTVRAALPDLDTLNNQALKALVLAQHRTLTTQEEELHSKDQQLASRQAEIVAIAERAPEMTMMTTAWSVNRVLSWAWDVAD